MSRLPEDTNKKLKELLEKYQIKETSNIYIIVRWLEETGVWENWFAPLLLRLSTFSSLRLEEVYLFTACFVLLHKVEAYKEYFQVYTLKDNDKPYDLHIVVRELIERIVSHLEVTESSVFWKLSIFIKLLRHLICYQDLEFLCSSLVTILQTLPLSDLRIFLSAKENWKEWNQLLETYKIPIAKAPRQRQYSFVKRTLSHLCDLLTSMTAASFEDRIQRKEDVENLNNYMLWFYFSFQHSTMGLHLAIFIICFSDSESVDLISRWKLFLQRLKELLASCEDHCSIALERCWQLSFAVLLRILELTSTCRDAKPPCLLEASLRQWILTHFDFWKQLTGMHCCFPDISYFHALLDNRLFIFPTCFSYPSMISYLCTLFTICKAELAYKLYSEFNMYKERIETERSFMFSVTHLEQDELFNRQANKEHFRYLYRGQVRVCGRDVNATKVQAFGRLGALFVSEEMDKFVRRSESLNWNDIQWKSLCYSMKWDQKRETGPDSLHKYSISFLSNDEIDLEHNERTMYLICLEASNDIHPQVLQELYYWQTVYIANLYEKGKEIPEFFSNILTLHSHSLLETAKSELIVKDEIDRNLCLFPFIADTQALMTSLSHIMPSFQLEANENFRSSVSLRKLDENAVNLSCSFVASDKNLDDTSSIHLYDAQRAAVLASCLQRLVLIRGPPGTGKTEVASCIVRLLLQNSFVDMKQEHGSSPILIVIAQSNEAADHLGKKIIQHCYPEKCRYPGLDLLECYHSVAKLHPLVQPVLRLGRQSMDEDIRQFTMEGHYNVVKEFRAKLWKHLSQYVEEYRRRSQHSEEENWLTSLCQAIEEYETKPYQLRKYIDQIAVPWLEATSQKYLTKQELEKSRHWKRIALLRDCILLPKCDSLLQSFSQSFSNYFRELLSHCQLVITTFASLMKYAQYWPLDGHTKISAAVVEEAGLVTEWNQFILFSRFQPLRTILIGDDLQLAPIVQYCSANHAMMDQLSSNYVSLFSRLIHVNFPFLQLEEQGRAAPCIADLYRFRYQTTSKQNGLNDIYPDNHFWMPNGLCSRILFLHVPVGHSQMEPFADSPYENRMEVKAIAYFLQYLYCWNTNCWNRIAILTPYRKQKKLLKDSLPNYLQNITGTEEPQLPVNQLVPVVFTTDEFQGKEKDIILISLVLKSSVLTSHLRDERRINLLTSRARCGVYLFGNYSVFYKHPEWKCILDRILSLAHSCRQVYSSQSSQSMKPLCTTNTTTPGSQSVCVWRHKDVMISLQKWLQQHCHHPKASLEQLFSQWKI